MRAEKSYGFELQTEEGSPNFNVLDRLADGRQQ